MDFERFTNQTKEAIGQSQQILQRYQHNQLDTEHILLALLEQEGGVVPRVLEEAGQIKHQIDELEAKLPAATQKWANVEQLDDTVDGDDVAQIISDWTGIPVTRMFEEEARKLLEMEDRLH